MREAAYQMQHAPYCPKNPFGEIAGGVLDSILMIHMMGGQSASIAYERRLLSFSC